MLDEAKQNILRRQAAIREASPETKIERLQQAVKELADKAGVTSAKVNALGVKVSEAVQAESGKVTGEAIPK
jgi:phage shock protein A